MRGMKTLPIMIALGLLGWWALFQAFGVLAGCEARPFEARCPMTCVGTP